MISARHAVRVVLLLAVVAWAGSAHAYVECTVTPKHFFVTKNGDYLWITWVEGGASTISGSASGVKSAQAMVMMAMSSGRTMTVRYPDGTACNAIAALDGLWFKG